MTVAEVAHRLGVSDGAVIHWINRGWLAARRGLNNRWCVPFGPDVEHACRERVAASVHLPRVDDPTPPTHNERTIAQVAAALGISTNVIYYWIDHDQIDARRGAGGRWLITFTADVEAACRHRVAASVRIKPVP